jgi:hypothetical protein
MCIDAQGNPAEVVCPGGQFCVCPAGTTVLCTMKCEFPYIYP